MRKVFVLLVAWMVIGWIADPVCGQSTNPGRRPGARASRLSPAVERRRSGNPQRVVPARYGPLQAFDDEETVAPPSDAEIVEGEILDGDVIVDGEYYDGESYDGEIHVEGNIACDSCGGHGCDSCAAPLGEYCDSCSAPRRFCICFPLHGWVQADYLLWWGQGMNVPPMVTTSPDGTDRTQAGVLGQPGTTILYGGDQVLTRDISGWRIRYGWWLDKFPGWGLEGEYTGVGTLTESFFAQSSGSPILARPFFNARDGAEDAQLLAFPDTVTGSIAVDVSTRIDGVAARIRKQLCGKSGCGYSHLCCTTVPTASRWDMTVGYRYWELDDTLLVREQLQMQDPNDPGDFDITDRFETRNQFNGAEIGFLWQGRKGLWSLDAVMRLGIGNVHQTAWVSGSTAIDINGTVSNFNNGILAQRTNSGTFEQDRFTMVPEIGLTLGYQLTKGWRTTAGYSLVYWGNVARAGDLIDTDLNPNLFAPEVSPFTGPLRPQFQFDTTDYWIQGLSLGAEYRW